MWVRREREQLESDVRRVARGGERLDADLGDERLRAVDGDRVPDLAVVAVVAAARLRQYRGNYDYTPAI